MKATEALIVLSGGQDSTICLFWAREHFKTIRALSFDYGQRHSAELDAARRVAQAYDVAEHRIMNLDLGLFGGSALTDRLIDVPTEPTEGIPVTYVPARNTIFLSFRAALFND